MRNVSFFTLIIICLYSIVGCNPRKYNINYINDLRDSTHTRIWQDYEVKIQPGDKLSITVTALNPASTQAYSLGQNGSGNVATVDEKGTILYPQLGFIKAAGLTRLELRNVLLEKLKVYLTDPVVTVEFSNFKITMLGEVRNQGPISVPDGHITILEALGQAGSFTPEGKRDSVLIIREENGKREFGYLNLLSNEVFKSPYFILQQNDVVYVPLLKNKAYISEKQEKPVNLSNVYTALGILTSVTLLILQLTR